MSWRYNWVIRIHISKKNRHHNVFKISKGWSGSVKTFCCLFLFDIRILVSPLVSSRHYIVCSSLIYGFWLPLWYLQDIILYNWVIRIHISKKNRHHNVFKISKGWSGSVNRGRTDNTMSWRYIRILITPLYLQDIILSALLWYTDSDYPFGIFKTLYCLLFVYRRRTDITMSSRYQRGDQDP
jgi:hypothetical protein